MRSILNKDHFTSLAESLMAPTNFYGFKLLKIIDFHTIDFDGIHPIMGV